MRMWKDMMAEAEHKDGSDNLLSQSIPEDRTPKISSYIDGQLPFS